MQKEFNYLLSKINVSESSEHGAIVKLIDYEHTDYIEDVLVEHFDLEYEYKIIDNENNEYILCFAKKATTKQVEKAITTINNYHTKYNTLYETI